jgi:hypothetical protein
MSPLTLTSRRSATRQPRQIEYRKRELPADLTEQDWSVELLELIKRTNFAEVVDSKCALNVGRSNGNQR